MSATENRTFQRAVSAFKDGRLDAALVLFDKVLRKQPDFHDAKFKRAATLFRLGRMTQAVEALAHLVKDAPAVVEYRIRYAQVLGNTGDLESAREQLEAALRLDPANVVLHLNYAGLCTQLGDKISTRAAYQRVAILIPNLGEFTNHPNVPPAIASRMRTAAKETVLLHEEIARTTLEQVTQRFPSARLSRLERALSSVLAREKPVADAGQRPQSLYMPELEAKPWFEREELDWVEQVESRAQEIASELENLSQQQSLFKPYLTEHSAAYTEDEGFEALRGSMNWRAFHLFRDGKPLVDQLGQCPITSSLLEIAPFPRLARNSPEMCFSTLTPGGHITPHHGLMNVRLTAHLGLTIPEQCGIRVHTETRTWDPGKVLVFDDTFEHEAWNKSERARTVLILECWNPQLDEAERFGLEQFFGARAQWLDRFDGDAMLPEEGAQPRIEW